MKVKIDYNSIDSPYNSFLDRESNYTFDLGAIKPVGGAPSRTSTSDSSSDSSGEKKTKGGTVATTTLKSDGNASDIWIKNWIRSTSWKPKSVGFYINGQTGYAEFTNIFVSGTIEATGGSLGGFVIGPDYIRDFANTMGLASTITAGDDVRFWAGTDFDNRDNAPFRVYESGNIFAQSGTIGGFDMGIDYIRDNNDTMGLATTVTGGDDVRFWAGDSFANRDTAPFRVYESGKLVADNVEINGGVIQNVVVAGQSGSGPPTGVPDAIGVIYIDTMAEDAYISVNTDLDTGWRKITIAPIVPRAVSQTQNITITESVTVFKF